MERLSALLDVLRILVTLLAIPGALWGLHLFRRWLRGEGIDRKIDELGRQYRSLQDSVCKITADKTRERMAIRELGRLLQSQNELAAKKASESKTGSKRRKRSQRKSVQQAVPFA